MSSRALALLPNAVGQKQQEIVYGEVSLAKPAPTAFTSNLYVVVPDWSPDYYYTIPSENWFACNNAALPQKGAGCLLIWDSQGTLTCPLWNGIVPVATSTSGTTAGYTGGSLGGMTIDGKSTGGLGSTGYTFGDIVLAMKQLKLLNL